MFIKIHYSVSSLTFYLIELFVKILLIKIQDCGFERAVLIFTYDSGDEIFADIL